MKYIKFFPFYLLSIIPLLFLYAISDLAYLVLYHIIKYRRKVVRMNLGISFPDKSVVEIIEIEKGFYKHFCDVFFEIVKILTINEGAITKRFIVKNMDMIEELYRQKKSVILYAAHHGNWEWLSFINLFSSYKGFTFYQEISNKYINDLMIIVRERFEAECIETRMGYRTLLEYKQKNILTLCGIIGDQCPSKKSSKHWAWFLNQNTAFLTGADRIANKLNQVVVFISSQKIKRGKYEIEFVLLEDKPKHKESSDIIDKYAEALEDTINKSPELWLWSHRRWKLKKPA